MILRSPVRGGMWQSSCHLPGVARGGSNVIYIQGTVLKKRRQSSPCCHSAVTPLLTAIIRYQLILFAITRNNLPFYGRYYSIISRPLLSTIIRHYTAAIIRYYPNRSLINRSSIVLLPPSPSPPTRDCDTSPEQPALLSRNRLFWIFV